MSREANVALLRGMALRHRDDAEKARALGQEATARSSERVAALLEREAMQMEHPQAPEETPITTPKVLL